MIDTNYNIKALEYLLNKDCLPEKYYPLIPFKDILISLSETRHDYKTKNDITELSDEKLRQYGLSDEKTIGLLRRFLKLYDPNPQKFKEIEKLDLSKKERLAFQELYFLPGVRETRASLYYNAGYKSLIAIAKANPNEIIGKTALVISEQNLPCIVPLPKEVRTHIAVAKAFTQF